jgi:prepilin-type N-terminal cleavage/methylation domain-containing protein
MTTRSHMREPGASAGAGQGSGIVAFTLLELLVVIGIVGILSSLALPSLRHLGGGNVPTTGGRQLLDDLAFARSKAIASRTTVYVVFFGGASTYGIGQPPFPFLNQYFLTNTFANNLLAGQYASYALFVNRDVGEQPGRFYERYVSDWKRLPEGMFVRTNAFVDGSIFLTNRTFPMPEAVVTAPRLTLPYVAFEASGRLVGRTTNISIPLSQGSVITLKVGATQTNLPANADFVEAPPNNSVVSFNRISINWLTGRSRIERPELP